MKESKSVRSEALDILRFPLAVVIVTVHVFMSDSFTMQGIDYNLNDYVGFRTFLLFSKSFLSGQSVPIYFFIAGYVFFLGIRLTKETYIRKMRNRFNSLFIPYVTWNTLAILCGLIPFIPYLHKWFPNCNYEDLNINIRSIADCFWVNKDIIYGREFFDPVTSYHPADAALWFVRDLMIVALSTPIINWFYNHLKATLPVLSGLLWFFMPPAINGHMLMLITAVSFFSLGGYLSFNQRDMVVEFKKIKFISYWIYGLSALVLFVYSLLNFKYIGFSFPFYLIKNMAVISGLFCAYNIAVWLVQNKGWKSSKILSSVSFFIYAGHMLILSHVLKLVAVVIKPLSDLRTIMIFVLTDVIICAILFILYMFMKRYCPKFLSLFTGGRL